MHQRLTITAKIIVLLRTYPRGRALFFCVRHTAITIRYYGSRWHWEPGDSHRHEEPRDTPSIFQEETNPPICWPFAGGTGSIVNNNVFTIKLISVCLLIILFLYFCNVR